MSQYCFGIHAVTSILQRQASRVKRILVQKERQDQRIIQLLALAEKQGIQVSTAERKELDRLVEGSHQGVIAEVEALQARNETFLEQLLEQLDETPFLLVLDKITDPHNLGACLRTADAAGVHAVIAPKDRSAPLNSTVLKVACGASHRYNKNYHKISAQN